MRCKARLALGSAVSFMALLILISGATDVRCQPQHRSKAPRRLTVTVQGYLFSHLARPGQPIGFAMSISNLGTSTARQFWLAPGNGLGYTITGLCVWRDATPVCRSVPSNPPGPSAHQGASGLEIIQQLKSGQSVAVRGSLTLAEPASGRTIAAVVGWTRADGDPSQTTVSIGEVNTPAVKTVTSSTLYSVLKDLLLPLTLLALPFLFHMAARRRAQLDQTWNLMLPESYKLMTRHYMSLDGALKRIIGEFDEHGNRPDWSEAEIARLLYELSLFGKGLRHLRKAVGGFYFKNRMGEVLASGCLHSYLSLFLTTRDVERDHSELLNRVRPFEPFDSFLNKLGPLSGSSPGRPAAGTGPSTRPPVPIFLKSFKNLQEWLRGHEAKTAVDYLRGLHAVLRFEMNRPFECWYDSEEPLEITQETRRFLMDNADKIAEGYKIEYLKKQLGWYLGLYKKRRWLVKPGLWQKFRL